jgi:hypothetical protein
MDVESVDAARVSDAPAVLFVTNEFTARTTSVPAFRSGPHQLRAGRLT